MKSNLRIGTVLAAGLLSLSLSGCGAAENTSKPISSDADTSAAITETTLAETEETTMETTVTEALPPVTYPCQYSADELHCTYDDVDIFGTLYTPQNNREKHPAVILSHGYNCIGDDMKDIAMSFAENGIAAYTYDFCGGSSRSKSSGDSVDMSIETEQENLRHVIDMISQTECIESSQIYLYGESQGGFVSALTGAEMPDRIAGMFLIYPAFCIPDQWLSMNTDQMEEPFDFMGLKLSKTFYDGVPRYDVYEHISAFTNPVLIYQGDKDPVVSVSYVEKIRDSFPDASLTIVEGAGHGFGGKDRQLVKDGVCDYFAENGLNS